MGPPVKRAILLELLQANHDDFADDGGIPLGLVYKWIRREKIYIRTNYAAAALKSLHEDNLVRVEGDRVVVV